MTPNQTMPENNDEDARAELLIRDGYQELENGNTTQAYCLWRQAATLRPQNEQVWLALLEVVETPADHEACLENILAINPGNKAAAKRLRALRLLTHGSSNTRAAPQLYRCSRRCAFWLLFLITITAMVGIAITLPALRLSLSIIVMDSISRIDMIL